MRKQEAKECLEHAKINPNNVLYYPTKENKACDKWRVNIPLKDIKSSINKCVFLLIAYDDGGFGIIRVTSFWLKKLHSENKIKLIKDKLSIILIKKDNEYVMEYNIQINFSDFIVAEMNRLSNEELDALIIKLKKHNL